MASPDRVKSLSTTGYAVLGLLTLRDWTAYELEQQAKRSLHYISPRARSVVYAEPKRLVRLGLATARPEQRGRRTVAIYSITDDGWAALRAWAGSPAEFPTLEAPVLIRTLFAGFGDPDGLVSALRGQQADATARLDELRAQCDSYQADGGSFADRLPFIAANGVFLAGYLRLLRDWSAWAAEHVATLPDDAGTAHRQALAILADLAQGGFPTPSADRGTE